MLPICDKKNELLNSLSNNKRLLISSPAGSGKSTQIPQFLLDSGKIKGKIAVLQPRRLAARMLAERVAWERKVKIGSEIGFRIKFEDKTSIQSRIIFETEGILLREIISDNTLSQYGAIVFDEFHERHLSSDIALAICLDIQKKLRPDLLIIVMSATLNLTKMSEYLAPCKTICAQGQVFPVDIKYCDSASAKMTVWKSAAKAASILTRQNDGHTLIFMSGAYEIKKTIEELNKKTELKDFNISPLYGSLQNNEQDCSLRNDGRRKIIVATNIAETSITIDGITLVIDSGLAKVARYDGNKAINTLFTERITKASAAQRTGRAGRTKKGLCLRLWTEADNHTLTEDIEPEILRLDLSEALLIIKACGYKTLYDLKWVDIPAKQNIEKAENLLQALGASDKNGNITALGRKMASYPLSPRYAKILIEGQKQNCAKAAAILVSAAQGKEIWLPNFKRENNNNSDFIACVEAIKNCAEENFNFSAQKYFGIEINAAKEAWELSNRLSNERLILDNNTHQKLAKAFISVFPDRVAALIKSNTRYTLCGGKKASLNKNSAANGAKLIIAGEALEKQNKGSAETELSFACEIKPEWIKEIFPKDIYEKTENTLDENMLTPLLKKNTYYKDLLIESEIQNFEPNKAACELIAEEFISGRHKFTHWDDEVENWLSRVNFLAKVCPDFGIEPLTQEDKALIINDICADTKSVAEAKNKPVLQYLKDWYGWNICKLIEEQAPQRLTMPSGRKAKISYPQNGEPFLEAKIQDLYDIKETPRIAAGRISLIVHILAPSMRPVQVTKDLKSFWQESYPKLKPALARRYPKHKWL